MFAAYIIVTVLAAAANIYAATNDFRRPEWLVSTMNKLGVPESSLPILGVLKAAGAVGLLIGIGMPLIGIAAAAGLALFFVGAVITHLRARDYSLGRGVPVMFFLIAVAALVLGVYGRKTIV
jgi:DoxX-like family